MCRGMPAPRSDPRERVCACARLSVTNRAHVIRRSNHAHVCLSRTAPFATLPPSWIVFATLQYVPSHICRSTLPTSLQARAFTTSVHVPGKQSHYTRVTYTLCCAVRRCCRDRHCVPCATTLQLAYVVPDTQQGDISGIHAVLA